MSTPNHHFTRESGAGTDGREVTRRDLLIRAGQIAGGAALATALSGTGQISSAGATSVARNASVDRSVASLLQPVAGRHVQAVVSSHEMATRAGLAILGEGGTAADAAIAVAAALSVVEPWFSSALGGGTWALYYEAQTGAVTSLDGVGPVGSNATRADYEARAGSKGIHQAVVPGAWDGWMQWLDRYGRLDLGQVLAPAIRYAREGYSVSAQMAFWLQREGDFIYGYPDSARTYVTQGALPSQGSFIRQTEMAQTFEELVRAYEAEATTSRSAAVQAARDYFYRGPLAESIVAASERDGGYLTLDDFASFQTGTVDPISIDFRDGVTVYQNSPNSQGITMLLALNILKGYELSRASIHDPDAVHLQVEAIKLSFADRHWYVGDPDRIDVPVEELLSDEYAERQRSRINMEHALTWPIAGGLDDPSPTHTTTFHVVDRFGNAAAVTTSLGAQFLLIGTTGIHINNRMRMISVEPGNANELTPGYKVRHTSNPYLALRGGQPYLLGGNTGVDTQPQGQMQQVINVVEFGLGAQEAIDTPRFVSTAFPAGSYPWRVLNQLQMENGFPDHLLEELAARGHDIVVGQGIFGSANMIVVGEDGEVAQAGAESRSDTAFGHVIPAAA